MKKVLAQALLFALGTMMILGILYFIGQKVQVQNAQDQANNTVSVVTNGQTFYPPQFIGGNPAPDWSNGWPIPFMTYGDCLSGCIQSFNWLLWGADFVIWFIVGYLIFRTRHKIQMKSSRVV